MLVKHILKGQEDTFLFRSPTLPKSLHPSHHSIPLCAVHSRRRCDTFKMKQLFCSSYFHLTVSIFTSFAVLSSCCPHSAPVVLLESHFVFNGSVAHTSAAGMPSGGRHCSNTSCSRDTSLPRGSCSKDFFRSEGRERDEKRNIIYTEHVAKLAGMFGRPF